MTTLQIERTVSFGRRGRGARQVLRFPSRTTSSTRPQRPGAAGCPPVGVGPSFRPVAPERRGRQWQRLGPAGAREPGPDRPNPELAESLSRYPRGNPVSAPHRTRSRPDPPGPAPPHRLDPRLEKATPALATASGGYPGPEPAASRRSRVAHRGLNVPGHGSTG